MSQRIKLVISYDGGNYAGWQRQTNALTVQEVLERALEKLFKQRISASGCSRTDTGVHALGQIVHFDAPVPVTKFKDFVYALQSHLPWDIVIKDAFIAPEDFNASRQSIGKTYLYRIHNHIRATALHRNYVYWIRRPLDLEYLNSVSKILVGKQDFKCFQNSGGSVKTTVRHISQAEWYRRGEHGVVFQITGNGFLKQMVRNIVGTLLTMEREKMSPSVLEKLIETRDRRQAFITAPAHGLYLARVYYPESLDNKCRKL